MVECKDCFFGEDGKIYMGRKIKKYTEIGFIDRLLTNLFSPPLLPKITYTKKEAKKLGIDYKKNPKGFYVKSADRVRIPVNVI